MIIIDTPLLHDEVEETAVFTATPRHIGLQDAIVAMHSTEETFERVRSRALAICPNETRHTFADWEDACIRVLLELHSQRRGGESRFKRD